jgi:hypothetical protein
MSWREFEEGAPELATLGADLLNKKIAYLATTKKDGSPRLHPVRPFIGEGQLFLFIGRKSPKRRDLLGDGRFALHGSVFQSNGPSIEFLITGVASSADDPEMREAAFRIVGRDLPDQQALFLLSVDTVLVTDYDENRKPMRIRWSRARSTT